MRANSECRGWSASGARPAQLSMCGGAVVRLANTVVLVAAEGVAVAAVVVVVSVANDAVAVAALVNVLIRGISAVAFPVITVAVLFSTGSPCPGCGWLTTSIARRHTNTAHCCRRERFGGDDVVIAGGVLELLWRWTLACSKPPGKQLSVDMSKCLRGWVCVSVFVVPIDVHQSKLRIATKCIIALGFTSFVVELKMLMLSLSFALDLRPICVHTISVPDTI